MKVYIVNKYTWFARDQYEIDSIWETEIQAIKRSSVIGSVFRDIEEKEIEKND